MRDHARDGKDRDRKDQHPCRRLVENADGGEHLFVISERHGAEYIHIEEQADDDTNGTDDRISAVDRGKNNHKMPAGGKRNSPEDCLLYTSDAAEE